MKSVLAWLGAVLVVMAVLGALGPFDFRMCFGPKGYCNPVPRPNPSVTATVTLPPKILR